MAKKSKAKLRREIRNEKILSDYKRYISDPGSSKMVVYEAIADLNKVSTATVIKLIAKEIKNE